MIRFNSNNRWFGFLMLLMSLVSFRLHAQEENEFITGRFNHVVFEDFVQTIETQTNYYFYYNPTHLDSFYITLDVQAKPLLFVLNKVFQNSDFNYAIDSDHHVFITKGTIVSPDLPLDFFDNEEVKIKEELLAAYIPKEKKEKIAATSETKLYEIGHPSKADENSNASLAGKVIDAESGEPVIGAAIYIEKPHIGVVTDIYGYYSINLPLGRHELKIKSVGFKDTKRQILLHSDGKLDIEVKPDVVSLKEVVVEAEKNVNVSGVQMGREKIDIKAIKQIPTVFGETDLLRVVLTLPGVKSVGEGTTGFNVRGGATDQNLILFNDATIFNPSHLFGFFSAFNPDVVKNVELYKSSIPARFGGRLSSVLDVNTREGNKKKFAGSGGIGVITGRLTLEGPIIKNKTSFIVGVRSTYSDWLLKKIKRADFKNSSGSFYDFNVHVSHEFNEKNFLYLTGYYSKDRFRLKSDTTYRYNNANTVLKFKHVFSNRIFAVFTASESKYQYSVSSENNPVNAYNLSFGINQANLKADFTYFASARHTFDFGLTSILYHINPGTFLPKNQESLIEEDKIQKEKALERAVYFSDKFDVSPDLSLNLGIRYSLFDFLGPKDVIQYQEGVEKKESTVQDTVSYGNNKYIKTYHGPEFRFSARYNLSSNSSVKISYNSLRQYIHMLSNTSAISPTDTWKLSDSNIRPQLGSQLSLGLYRNLKSNTIETSVEIYYKWLKNYLDYKSGAVLIMNHSIEKDVVNTQGKAYGVEFMLKKLTGKLNGWVSYTYSRTLLRMNDPTVGKLINGGKYYPSNYDKPHDFTLVGNYKFSHRFSISLNVTYSTGRPITLPLGRYTFGGADRVIYSERNQYRIPNYFRTDFSMNIEGNHKVKKISHSSWTIALYNVTGRKNVYSIYFVSEGDQIKGYKLSIFGQAIPTITYNFKF